MRNVRTSHQSIGFLQQISAKAISGWPISPLSSDRALWDSNRGRQQPGPRKYFWLAKKLVDMGS
jgi:hypothetical protein